MGSGGLTRGEKQPVEGAQGWGKRASSQQPVRFESLDCVLPCHRTYETPFQFATVQRIPSSTITRRIVYHTRIDRTRSVSFSRRVSGSNATQPPRPDRDTIAKYRSELERCDRLYRFTSTFVREFSIRRYSRPWSRRRDDRSHRDCVITADYARVLR